MCECQRPPSLCGFWGCFDFRCALAYMRLPLLTRLKRRLSSVSRLFLLPCICVRSFNRSFIRSFGTCWQTFQAWLNAHSTSSAYLLNPIHVCLCSYGSMCVLRIWSVNVFVLCSVFVSINICTYPFVSRSRWLMFSCGNVIEFLWQFMSS